MWSKYITSQVHDGDENIKRLQGLKKLYMDWESSKWKKVGKCMSIDWIKENEVVVVGRRVTTDGKGTTRENSSKVRVDEAIKAQAQLGMTPKSNLSCQHKRS